jgi:hypothetical protein
VARQTRSLAERDERIARILEAQGLDIEAGDVFILKDTFRGRYARVEGFEVNDEDELLLRVRYWSGEWDDEICSHSLKEFRRLEPIRLSAPIEEVEAAAIAALDDVSVLDPYADLDEQSTSATALVKSGGKDRVLQVREGIQTQMERVETIRRIVEARCRALDRMVARVTSSPRSKRGASRDPDPHGAEEPFTRRPRPGPATGQDIQRGIHVPWSREAAVRTSMLPFGQFFGHKTAATGANLRCAVRVDPEGQSTGCPGLVLQHVQELTPGGISHALAHVAATEALDVQVFDGDEAVLSHQAGRCFVLEVPPLVGDALVQPPDLPAQLPMPAAAALAASTLPLEQRQFLFALSEPTRVLDHFTCRECGEVCQAHIDPDGWPVSMLDHQIGQLYLEDDVPIADAIPLEDGHLDLALVGDRAVLEQAQETNILNVEPAVSELDPVPVDVADGLEPAATLEARIAGFLTGFHAAEEGLERLVQPA